MDSPKIKFFLIFNLEPQYEYKINGGQEFNDIIAINGFPKDKLLKQSSESQTGPLTSMGRFHLPIINNAPHNTKLKAVEYLEVGRFRQLGKALGFGKRENVLPNITA